MFWVIQENLYNEYGYNELIHYLTRLNIPYTNVKVIPFANILAPSDFNSHDYKDTIDTSIEPYIDDTGLVMVCGSITLANIAKQRGWLPGSFLNDNFHYNKWKANYKENLLNYNSVVGLLNEIQPPWNEFFIRPCEDTKEFAGMTLTKEQLYNQANGITIEGMNYCNTNPLVMASPLQTIYAEYRFFVVDKKVITYSQYKSNGNLYTNAMVGEGVIEFAQKMVDMWQPARAFVIDIASTPDGLKIVEINNFNSAGFYACNVGKIIEAIEEMKF